MWSVTRNKCHICSSLPDSVVGVVSLWQSLDQGIVQGLFVWCSSLLIWMSEQQARTPEKGNKLSTHFWSGNEWLDNECQVQKNLPRWSAREAEGGLKSKAIQWRRGSWRFKSKEDAAECSSLHPLKQEGGTKWWMARETQSARGNLAREISFVLRPPFHPSIPR